MPLPLPPKGPKVPWPFGYAFRRDTDLLALVYGWSREFGDIFSWTVMHYRIVLVNRPDLIEQLLVNDHRKFIKGRGLQANRELFGNGLLTSEGDFWLRQRRLMQPAFHRERIAAYAETMVAEANALADSWRDGETRDVHADLMRVTLQIAGATLFGASVSSVADRVSRALGDLINQNTSPRRILPLLRRLPTAANRRYTRAVRQLDEVVYGIIADRRANPGEGHDLLAILLSAQDEGGTRMTDRQLRDECITLLLAGHETTALALTWGIYLLAQSLEAQEKLGTELDDVLGGRLPGAANVPQLTYTDRVVKEALRLYPPAWMVVRLAAEKCTMGDYRIPRRTSVLASPWVMHRNPRFYENPERFDPDRWTESFQKNLPRFAYFPFGGGPRMCIGAGFAAMEAVLLLAVLAQRFSFRLADLSEEIKPLPSITLRPASPVRVTLTRRPL